MNKLNYLEMAFVAIMTLTACGGSDHDEAPTPQPPTPPTPTQTGKNYKLTCDLPAQLSEKTVALTGLKADIDRQSGKAAWLDVKKQTYTGGTPQVVVSATENLEKDERQQDITFYSQKDTLVLTVRQAAYKGGGTDVNNPNDTPTDQPAYAPKH